MLRPPSTRPRASIYVAACSILFGVTPAGAFDVSLTPEGSTAFRLGFMGEAGQRYRVQSSSDLLRWSEGGEWLQGSGGRLEVVVPYRGLPSGFFRIRSEPVPPEVFEGYAYIPAGSFIMGSPEGELGRHHGEGPQQEVTLSTPFYLKETEVTWAEWNAVLNRAAEFGYDDINHGHNGRWGVGGRHPVTCVSWWDCIKWCNLLSEIEGRRPVYGSLLAPLRNGQPVNPHVNWGADGYRLPTEAEWEYACRAGTTTAFYTGPITDTRLTDPNLEIAGWYDGNSFDPNAPSPFPNGDINTHPAGLKQPNAWGLYDMHGNVNEWCWDFYQTSYYQLRSPPLVDPMGPPSGGSLNRRIVRGGGFNSDASLCRSATRRHFPAGDADWATLGFRPAFRAETP